MCGQERGRVCRATQATQASSRNALALHCWTAAMGCCKEEDLGWNRLDLAQVVCKPAAERRRQRIRSLLAPREERYRISRPTARDALRLSTRSCVCRPIVKLSGRSLSQGMNLRRPTKLRRGVVLVVLLPDATTTMRSDPNDRSRDVTWVGVSHKGQYVILLVDRDGMFGRRKCRGSAAGVPAGLETGSRATGV